MSLPISIVIATYNRAENLRRTLASLRYLRYQNFEVIVVPGPCTDNTSEVLSHFSDDIRVVPIEERNLSRARNYGIACAKGEIVAFLDDDAIPEPDWLDHIVRLFDQSEVVAVGGYIRDNTGYNFQARVVVCDEFGRGKAFESLDAALSVCAEEPNRYLSLTGANVAFRKEALIEISGFDETFEYFLDETDVNIRLHPKQKVTVAAEAEVHHKYAESHLRNAKNVPKNMYPITRSVAYFAMKHALPKNGWTETTRYLKQFELSEIGYKTENYKYGDIDNETLGRLCSDIRRGIRDGIARGIKPESIGWTQRVSGYPEQVFRASQQNFRPLSPIRQKNERLKLCMFSQQEGFDVKGGIARWTEEVASGLADLGHEVTVIGLREAGSNTVDFTEKHYWSHRLNLKRNSASAEVNLLDLPAPQRDIAFEGYREYERIYPRRQFNVISSPIWDVEGAALFGLPQEKRKAPIVLSLHTTYLLALPSKPEWREYPEYFENHIMKIIRAERIALQKADLILANSKAVVEDIEKAYNLDLSKRNMVYVPHGISDLPTIGLFDKSERGSVKILFVGRLEKRKGITILIDSLIPILDSGLDIEVNIVGAGSENEETRVVQAAQAKYPGKIFHRGYVSDTELNQFYVDADIFFAPSEYESFGLIAIEAMRAGLPCVVSKVGGLKEVVENGRNGFLLNPKDAHGFNEAIMRLCEDRNLRLRMGTEARRSYEDNYTVRKMCSSLEKAYSMAVGGK